MAPLKVILIFSFGITLIGQEGSHAFWLLVQHAPDLKVQKQCLSLLEQAVMRHDADPIDLAYLTDRVFMFEDKKQIYGTQFQFIDNQIILYPIAEEEHVNERRLSIGLCSLEEYIELVNESYKDRL